MNFARTIGIIAHPHARYQAFENEKIIFGAIWKQIAHPNACNGQQGLW
jgi:hypothetical protein